IGEVLRGVPCCGGIMVIVEKGETEWFGDDQAMAFIPKETIVVGVSGEGRFGDVANNVLKGRISLHRIKEIVTKGGVKVVCINHCYLDSNFFILSPAAKGIGDGVVCSFYPLELGADGLEIIKPMILAG